MADDLKDEIKLGLDASGVETGVAKAKRSIDDLGKSVDEAGKRGGRSFDGVGHGANKASSEVDSATKRMVSSLQRQVAAAEAGGTATRAYQESIARLRGANMDVLRPYLDQLDQANRKTEEAKSQAEGLTNAFRGVSNKIVALASGVAAAFSLRKFIDETVAAQNEQAQLAAVLKSTGNAAGFSQQRLNDMAEQMARATKFSTGEINTAQTRLLSYTGVVGEQLPRALQAAANMSTRMGIDLASASEQVGRALDVPSQGLTALTRQGFRFTEEQKELITKLEETGKTAEAQGIILAALESSYGGAATAARDTLGGALKALQNNINSLMTGEGGSITGLRDGIESVNTVLSSPKTREAFQTFLGWIATVSAKAIEGAANLLTFIQSANWLGIITGSDKLGKLKAEAADVTAHIARLTDQAERYQESISRGFNVDQNQRNLERTRQKIGELQKQAMAASQQLKDFANAGVKAATAPILTPDLTVVPPKPTVPKGDAAAANKELSEQAKLLAELSGLTSSFYSDWDRLNAMYRAGKLSVDQLTEAQGKLLEKQPAIKANMAEQAKAQELVNKSMDAQIDAITKQFDAMDKAQEAIEKARASSATSAQQSVTKMRDENEALRLAAAMNISQAKAIELVTIKRLEETRAQLLSQGGHKKEIESIEQEIAARKELINQIGSRDEFVAAQQEMLDMWKSIDQTAHDVFVNIFEDGAGTFKRLGQTLKSAVLDMLYQLTVKRWIINIGASFGATGGIFGEGQGGAGSLLGTASNLNTAWGMLSGTGGNMGALTGLMSGSMSWANAMGSVYANTTGTGISGLLATNGAYGTAGGAGAGLGATAAGIAAIAAPLIIGALVERNSRDRFSGAAYATSGGNDPFVNTVAGSTGFNYLTGDLPDRAALMARLEELGAPMEAVSEWNDRALSRLLFSAGSAGEFGVNWKSMLRDLEGEADFYRGAGYTHPEAMGWWNSKGNDVISTDPQVIEASRNVALSIIEPLEALGRLVGDEATYRATVGFANRGKGKGVWAGFELQRDGASVAGWVNQDDYHSVGEGMRAMYSSALEALDSFDLPGWAADVVTDARAQLDGLSGEQVGQEAAALYQQTTAGIEQMYRSIQTLIDVFPDFAAATQDSLHGLQELMGGMDQLKAAYSSYIGAFWTEDERRGLMTAQLTAQLAELGQTMPTTRAEFRGMVEAALAAGESGNELAAALLGMSGAMSEVLAEVDAAAAKQRTDDVWQQLQRLFDEQIGNWKQLASEAKSIFTTADSAARSLRGNVSDTRAWDAVQGNAFIDAALAAARASGALPDADALKKAIDSARGGLDMGGYDTVAEYERDQLLLAGKLSELGDVAGNQMSFAEQQVKLLEDQRDYWKKQLDLLNTTGLTISSIDEGVSYLADYVRAEQAKKDAAAAEAAEQAKRSTTASSRGDWGGGGGGGGGPMPTREIDLDKGTITWPDGRVTYLTPDELAMYRGETKIFDPLTGKTYVYDPKTGKKVPAHAAGGYYAGGLALVGERGPELINFSQPGQVYNADQTRTLMGSDNRELVAELRQAREEAREAQRQSRELLQRLHDLMDRVTAGGNAMLVEQA